MKFYRVHLRCGAGSSAGFEWFTSRADAKRLVAAHNSQNEETDAAELMVVEVKRNKRGILSALNVYASHPDNG